MARNEQDREDILREATALVERIEFALPGAADSIIVGFRRDGSASFFMGVDPVFQFNSQHELRRAYVGGRLIKAERGQLVSLERHRAEAQVQLLRTELDAESVTRLLTTIADQLHMIGDHLRGKTFEVRGQVPELVDVVGRICEWLERTPTPVLIARRPHAG